MQTTITTDQQNTSSLITPADVAERLGLPADTVRGWVRRGMVPSVRFGPRGGRIGLEPNVIDLLRKEV